MAMKVIIPKDQRYLGDPLLKRSAVKYNYTKEEVEEYRKCKRSVKYFTEKYFKIVHVDKGLITYKPRNYQRKLVRLIHKNRFAIIKQARQSGKCVHKNSLIRLRNKKTKEIIEITIGEFYNIMCGNFTVIDDDPIKDSNKLKSKKRNRKKLKK